MKIKKIFIRMTNMCPLSWYITKRTLQFCCILLLGACALLAEYNGNLSAGYAQYMTATALNEISQALLLISVIFSLIIEDVQS